MTLASGIAGCASPLNSRSSAPETATTRDAFLEKYVSAYQQAQQENYTVKWWETEWENSTAVELEYVIQNKTSGNTMLGEDEVMVFPSTDAATSYIDGQSPGYSLASTVFPSDGAYQRATGHAPGTYKEYTKYIQQTPLDITSYSLTQLDNIVATGTMKQI